MKLYLTVFFLAVSGVVTYLVINYKDNFSFESKYEVKSDLNYKELIKALNNLTFLNYDEKKNELYFEKTDILIIHLWASWCSPCVNEVPEIIDYSRKLENNVNIKLITASLDENKEDIHKFLVSFPDFNKDPIIRVWDKNKELSRLLNVDKLPSTVIINKMKSEVRVLDGVVDWKSLKL